jgi:para-aminobenzoate synthetase component I
VFVWDAAQGSIALDVHVVGTLPADAEFHRYFERVVGDPFAVLLDSAAVGSRFSQRSVIALEPEAVLVAWGSPLLAAGLAQLELHTWGQDRHAAAEVQRYEAEPFAELERLLEAQRMPADLRAQLPDGFVGGALGFVGYDAGRWLERLPERAQRDLDVPELCLLFVDSVLVFEHDTRVLRCIARARGSDDAQARARCAERMASLRARFAAAPLAHAGEPVGAIGEVQAGLDARAYAAMVNAAKEQIALGNVFEACVAQRLEAAFPAQRSAAWHLYLALRAESPAPFACCIATPWACLLSSSPERFLQLSAQGWAESRPIKGTRPRGQNAEHDARLREELATSEKDRAENVMIVDLVRNDLGRVCAVDSIHVPELMVVEEHPSVFQLVSTVRGRVEPEVSAVQLFCACFPPGSMTGAPKIEAMKVIDALEPVRRAVYAGAVGYFDLGGTLDFSVVIRSFVISGGRCTISVGGAVVADSEPDAEYRESMDKARALLAALERTR